MEKIGNTPNLILENQNNILTITFNRPNKKNALTLDMYKGITEGLKLAEESKDIKTVLFKGQEDCFTAGNDIADFLDNKNLDESHPVVIFLYTIANFKKPIIAAVSGEAIGIGTTLLLHCDLVYAAVGSKFQLPFINLGLCPEAASSLLLPNTIGIKKSTEMLMLGNTLNETEAKNIGLINDVFSKENLFAEAYKVAIAISKKPTNAIIKTKELLNMHLQDSINKTIKTELLEFAKMLQSNEAKQAFSMFLSKNAS